jgi:hypothetical protein
MRSAGVIEGLLQGAIDFHVHAGPDPFSKRRLDVFHLALQAKEAGMKAIVAKNHHFGTALLASLVNTMVPDFTIVGSLVLNREAGGLNPDVVTAAVRAGAKVIWMPTTSSRVDSKVKPGIALVDKAGHLLPEVMTILHIIRENQLVLGTGHVSQEEIFSLTREARGLGIKVIITHPLTTGFGCTLTMDQQQELVSMGAVIEHCFVACMPVLGGMNPKIIIEHIRAVGPENCILSTDFGQDTNPSPPEGFRSMVGTMLHSGLSEKELEMLVKTNPAKLLCMDHTDGDVL